MYLYFSFNIVNAGCTVITHLSILFVLKVIFCNMFPQYFRLTY